MSGRFQGISPKTRQGTIALNAPSLVAFTKDHHSKDNRYPLKTRLFQRPIGPNAFSEILDA